VYLLIIVLPLQAVKKQL